MFSVLSVRTFPTYFTLKGENRLAYEGRELWPLVKSEGFSLLLVHHSPC